MRKHTFMHSNQITSREDRLTTTLTDLLDKRTKFVQAKTQLEQEMQQKSDRMELAFYGQLPSWSAYQSSIAEYQVAYNNLIDYIIKGENHEH